MDRNKVIKGLECCLWGSDWDKKCDECPYEATEDEKKHVDWDCHLDGLRKDALALLKGSGWISVRDGLPEMDHVLPEDGIAESKPVLVYGIDPDGRKVYGVATYLTEPNDESWNEWDGVMVSVVDAIYCEITHWAPIPDAPKEADDATD